MRFPLPGDHAGGPAAYRVLAVNTVGLETGSARPGQGGSEMRVVFNAGAGDTESSLTFVVEDTGPSGLDES
ncbi:MAG: hypothetical protein O3A37_01120 [Planctomycetota bacterium]|jgi:hypothetical protein|nr:hypothetical protein [Planctomycetota bacterium]